MPTAMLIAVGVIVVLLLLSAFFTAAETSLSAASRASMHQLEHKGSRRARLVNRLSEHHDELIGSILFARNLVNILASVLAASILIALSGMLGILYATALMAVLIIVFFEALPRSYATRNADSVALFVAPIVQPVLRMFAPAIWFGDILTHGTLHLFGITADASETASVTSENGGEAHAGTGTEEEDAGAQERAMLTNVLDLSQVEVGEIMVHRRTVVRLNADNAAETILEQVLNSPHTRLPLWRGEPDNIIGIVHVRDILKALRAAGGQTSDIDIEALASPPWFVPETTTLLDQLQAFRARHEHFALVIDEYGSLLGVVTLEDIIEEIVGDITDEFDVTRSGLRPQTDGSILIDGQYTIRDLNRQMNWRLPDDHASTIAGLVLHEARRIPEVGQTFLFHGMRFEILRRQRHQITVIRLTPPQEAQDSPDVDETG